MVTQPSRRAFLTGRRTSASPWGQFCARLSRTCVGRVRWEQGGQTTQAWLEPARAVDVMHAQVLCRELGVQLILLNSEACPDSTRPILWVDSRADWAQMERVSPESAVWRVDAGVTLGTLHQKGVGVFAKALAANLSEWTLAQWYASSFSGNMMQSGIVQAEVLLSDGTLELLGPFGAKASQPLRSLSLQRKIPQLFELAQSGEAARCAESEKWPSRYRLDALMPQSGDSLNLAWLFKGHGGSLAWMQTLWLQIPEGSLLPHVAGKHASSQETSHDTVNEAVTLLDRSVKQILDPTGVFGGIPPAKGLESPSI